MAHLMISAHRMVGILQVRCIYGLTTLNKQKFRQVSTIVLMMESSHTVFFNVSVPTSVELKTNTNKLELCRFLLSTCTQYLLS